MARKKSPNRDAASDEPSFNALMAGKTALLSGDYPLARQLLEGSLNEGSATEADQREARRLLGAMRLDKTSMMVGLGCLLLLVLVIGVTVLKQP